MKKRILLITGLLLFVVCFSTVCTANSADGLYNVLNFGAKGDGKALDTKAIREVIEKAAQEGGGTVYFPAGKFVFY